MECRYVAIYKLLGIRSLPGEQDVDLINLPEFNAVARLTADPDDDCFHIDRSRALAIQSLKNITGQADEGDLPSRLAVQQREVKENRKTYSGAGVFLVIKGEVEITDPDFRHRQDFDDFAFCFNAFSKDAMRNRFRNVVNGVLAAIGMGIAANQDLRVKKVGDVSYLWESGTGKAIYSSTMNAGRAVVSVSGPLQDETTEFVRIHAKRLCTDRPLSKVANLLIQSLETATDEIRSFIVAWAALEIFVNSLFKDRYDREWLEKLASGAPASSHKYFERLKEVMKDKYRLSDKFLVIASLLNEDSAEEDAVEFKRLKDIRDNLFHGGGAETLPVEQVQALLRNYLTLHLECSA